MTFLQLGQHSIQAACLGRAHAMPREIVLSPIAAVADSCGFARSSGAGVRPFPARAFAARLLPRQAHKRLRIARHRLPRGRGGAAVLDFETPACLQGMGPALSLRLLRVLFGEVDFASMDFLSAINLQLALLVFGVLVLLVVTSVLVSFALREW